MTSQEIKKRQEGWDDETQAWWEIALQVALMNEKNHILADPEQGKRDAAGMRGGCYESAHQAGARALRWKTAGIVASLRSCAQTIAENHMDGPRAANYLMKYAETVESQGSQPPEPSTGTSTQNKENIERCPCGCAYPDHFQGALRIGSRVQIVKPKGYSGRYQGTGTVVEFDKEFTPRPWGVRPDSNPFPEETWWFPAEELSPLTAQDVAGPFPRIARDADRGDGLEWWGVWFGPGQAFRTFETEGEAKAWLANLAENMNRDAWQKPDWICACGYVNFAIRQTCRNFNCRAPKPQGAQESKPSTGTSTQNKETIDGLADPEQGKRDAAGMRGGCYESAHQAGARALRWKTAGIVASLRSCAQTIAENHMDGPRAVNYLMNNAKAIEAQQRGRCSNCSQYDGVTGDGPAAKCSACGRMVIDSGQFRHPDRENWPGQGS